MLKDPGPRNIVKTAFIVLAVLYVCLMPLLLARSELAFRRQALRTLVTETQGHAAVVAMYLNDRRHDVRSMVEGNTIQDICASSRDPAAALETIARFLDRMGTEKRTAGIPAFSSLVFISKEGDFRLVPVADALPVPVTYEALRSLVKHLYIRPTYLTFQAEDGPMIVLLSVAVVSGGAVHGQLLAVLNPEGLDGRLRDSGGGTARASYLISAAGDVYSPGSSPPEWVPFVASLATADHDHPAVFPAPSRGNGTRSVRVMAVRTVLPASEFSLVSADAAMDLPTVAGIGRRTLMYLLAGVVLLGAVAASPFLQDLAHAAGRRQEAEESGLFRTLFDHLPDGVAVTDAGGIIQCANRAFQKQTGLDADALSGRAIRALLGEVLDEPERGGLNRAYQGRQNWLGRLRGRRGSGIFTAETLILPVRGRDDAFSGLIAIQRDITAMIQAEERLRQAQKMETVGVLADGIAHDFNNLLTVIQGNCNLLLHGADSMDPFARDNIDEIMRACDRAATMTRRLLAFSRHKEALMQVLDLNEVVGSTEKMLGRLIRENIEMVVDLAESPVLVKADLVQIEQVIINLTVNARDAMPRGGRLAIRVERRVLTAREAGLNLEEGVYAVLTVEDTGHGMDEATRRRIFDPFFTTKSEKEGTGLGLTTVAAIVKEHGGDLLVRSEVGAGASFVIFLPLYSEPFVGDEDLPTQELVLEAPAAPSLPRLADGDGAGILILDDEDAVLRMIERALAAHGFRVFAARTDVELLVIWEEHRDEIDLLITDMVMPGMSGVEIAARLRQDRPSLLVLSISAYTDTVIMKLGGTEKHDTVFLQKPFTPDTLVGKVEGLLACAPAPGEGEAEVPTP
ncbi:MAG: response regulator [Lentisphaeria bacterium]|nr:response regulator [Lentisphaeria bacterium]